MQRSEWERLKSEKAKLRKGIKEAYEAQEKAREELRVAFAREMRLRQQMDLLDRRAEEAIAVEEGTIRDLEAAEQQEAEETITFDSPSRGLALNLSPQTWSALDGMPDSFWDFPDSGGIAIEPSGS
ncbi:hypothetical protein H2203_002535 [Taxawa tesnikishii (nom. ined.)]|nr:hypothetical protein H2203_009280 [Dothideales sp. JES 119]KAJ9622495.1 hypothetical protein H2203_006720 [Dothideales sp. JES 119]KAJ9623866.1 hypothetical protein H2203_005311 [Dothideales sp. JES 119]KAJ9628633.1 hypothetical protein H2203_002535 [Dothideales sp. JES 119]